MSPEHLKQFLVKDRPPATCRGTSQLTKRRLGDHDVQDRPQGVKRARSAAGRGGRSRGRGRSYGGPVIREPQPSQPSQIRKHTFEPEPSSYPTSEPTTDLPQNILPSLIPSPHSTDTLSTESPILQFEPTPASTWHEQAENFVLDEAWEYRTETEQETRDRLKFAKDLIRRAASEYAGFSVDELEEGKDNSNESEDLSEADKLHKPPASTWHEQVENFVLDGTWENRTETEQETRERLKFVKDLIRRAASEFAGFSVDELEEGEDYANEPEDLLEAVKFYKPELIGRSAVNEDMPWYNISINAPFQEDLRKNIWRREARLKAIDELDLRDLYHLKRTTAIRYKYMLAKRTQGKEREELIRKLKEASLESPIQEIIEVVHQNYGYIYFPIFIIERANRERHKIHEVDLPCLVPNDLYQLFFLTRQLNRSEFRNRLGFNALKRLMLRHIKFSMTHDLQIAIENNMRTVNLTKPLSYDPCLNDYSDYHIFDNPEIGIVFSNHLMEKRILLLSEIAKFSDGTLKIIFDNLGERIRTLEKETTWEERHDTINLYSEAVKAIEERLNLRGCIRQFDHNLGLRKD